jgi:hypothetical protein
MSSINYHFGDLFIDMDEEKIVFRQNQYTETETLRWNRITSIYMMPFEVMFLLDNDVSMGLFLNDVGAENSMKVKNSLRGIAESKAIQIVLSTWVPRKD